MKNVKKYFRSLWATFSKKKNNCIVFCFFLSTTNNLLFIVIVIVITIKHDQKNQILYWQMFSTSITRR
jgi:hypothetical protein